MTSLAQLPDVRTIREAAEAVTAAHLFTYLVPETAEEAARLGVTERAPAYFAFRAAAMGAVPWQVVFATFYNFSPRAVQTMTGAWEIATPSQWQAARFTAVERAMQRVGLHLPASQITEARALLDQIIANAEYAGKPLAAANASVPLPGDPLVALWQQITVIREWRGDAHLLVLADHDLGPCDCLVLHTATGRLPVALARRTRQWTDDEWAAATDRLATRGWLTPAGTVTDAGAQAREQIESETDERCAPLWASIGLAGVRRLTSLIKPIGEAFAAAGTYRQLD